MEAVGVKAPAINISEIQVVHKLALAGAFGAFAFVLSGPLQHVGALPKTVIGDASNGLIKVVLNKSVEPAWDSPLAVASCSCTAAPSPLRIIPTVVRS